MKAIDILNIYHVFMALAEKELDLNTACVIAKNIHTLSVLKNTIEARREKLIETYALRDDAGKILADENGMLKGFTDGSAFNHEMNELLSTEVPMGNDLIPVSKESLSGIQITPQTLLPLITFDLLREESL